MLSEFYSISTWQHCTFSTEVGWNSGFRYSRPYTVMLWTWFPWTLQDPTLFEAQQNCEGRISPLHYQYRFCLSVCGCEDIQTLGRPQKGARKVESQVFNDLVGYSDTLRTWGKCRCNWLSLQLHFLYMNGHLGTVKTVTLSGCHSKRCHCNQLGLHTR